MTTTVTYIDQNGTEQKRTFAEKEHGKLFATGITEAEDCVLLDFRPDSFGIEVGSNWKDEPTILNPEDFIELVEKKVDCAMTPDGGKIPWEVENPHLNGDPEYLRVRGYRKATNTFRLIALAEEWGLKVADCWQLEQEKEDEIISFKLVPQQKELIFREQ